MSNFRVDLRPAKDWFGSRDRIIVLGGLPAFWTGRLTVNPYVKVAMKEVWRSPGCVTLWTSLLVLYFLGLLLPPRLSAAAVLALETLVALEVLASTLFAAILVAWPMGRPSWPWSLSQQGPLSKSPSAVILNQALGQGLIWVGFLICLVGAALGGLALQSWWLKTGAWQQFDWGRLGLATIIVMCQGFWLQALARFLAAAFPAAIAILVLIGSLIAGHFLGLESPNTESLSAWFRPGLEYLSQAQILRARDVDLVWFLSQSLAGALCFNLLAAWILGKRSRGLANLDPKVVGD